jgi:hypothetical protein
MNKNKVKAVRMFEHALRLVKRVGNMSGKTSGKLELSLQNYCRRIRKLSGEDPDHEFWSSLERANLKLIKYVRDLMR